MAANPPHVRLTPLAGTWGLALLVVLALIPLHWLLFQGHEVVPGVIARSVGGAIILACPHTDLFAPVAAGAGIHRRDQLEVGGRRERAAGARKGRSRIIGVSEGSAAKHAPVASSEETKTGTPLMECPSL